MSPEASQSGYLVGLTNLPGNPGATLELDLRMPLDSTWTNGVVQLCGRDIAVHICLTSVSEGVLARYSFQADTAAQCSRCLEPVRGNISIEDTTMFFFPDVPQDARAVKEEDWEDICEINVEKNAIDFEGILRDNLVLEMPNLPLCRPDCLGLCPQCGQRLEDLPAGHAHEVIDPRWAALAELSQKLNEEDNNK